jgi:hypothetical protein
VRDAKPLPAIMAVFVVARNIRDMFGPSSCAGGIDRKNGYFKYVD